MKIEPYVTSTFKDKLKIKFSVLAGFVGLGGLFMLLFPPIGVFLIISGLIAFLAIGGGSVKGNCPICGTSITVPKSMKAAQCYACKGTLLLDHNAHTFSTVPVEQPEP